MRPIKFEGADVVYLGPTPDIGDLWVRRVQPGRVEAVYELTDEDRALIAAGGRVRIGIYTEPMPPISLAVISEAECRPVGEHPWKIHEDPARPWPGQHPPPVDPPTPAHDRPVA
jgi:hypothetical protein